MAKLKLIAVVVIAAGALFFGPAAAHAAYVPAANITVTGAVTAGGTVSVDFADGSFAEGEGVSVALSCATTVTTTETATATGALNLDVAIPADATGTCTLTATGLTSGDIGTVALTIASADGGAGAGAGGSDDELADTGASDSSMLLIWGASGVLLLGVALVVVMTTVRRQRAKV